MIFPQHPPILIYEPPLPTENTMGAIFSMIARWLLAPLQAMRALVFQCVQTTAVIFINRILPWVLFGGVLLVVVMFLGIATPRMVLNLCKNLGIILFHVGLWLTFILRYIAYTLRLQMSRLPVRQVRSVRVMFQRMLIQMYANVPTTPANIVPIVPTAHVGGAPVLQMAQGIGALNNPHGHNGVDGMEDDRISVLTNLSELEHRLGGLEPIDGEVGRDDDDADQSVSSDDDDDGLVDEPPDEAVPEYNPSDDEFFEGDLSDDSIPDDDSSDLDYHP